MEHTFAKTETLAELPDDLLREIGRYIVRFARLETILSRFTYAILDIKNEEGRIAVREPRAKERFDMICDLLDNRSVASAADLKAIKSDLEYCEDWRNLLAHATWVADPIFHKTRLLKTSGQWRPTRNHPPKTKRKVAPEALVFEVTDAIALNSKLQKLQAAIDQWIDEFRPPQASR